jgi:putative CocE/NonD family hydrolase
MKSLLIVVVAVGLSVFTDSCPAAPSYSPDSPGITAPAFEFREVTIPVRDGVKLQTVLLIPRGIKNRLPILLTRTPYGVPGAAPDRIPVELKELAADGYVFAMQSIRGRSKSEGTFTLAADFRVTPGQGSIETRDAWDTIDWLVKHVPMNNGKTGMMGVSYAGYTTGVPLLKPHPALKAISEQAAPVDEWRFDDGHRYGALACHTISSMRCWRKAQSLRIRSFSLTDGILISGISRWDRCRT